MSSSSSTTKMSGRSGADAESTGGVTTDSAGRRIRLRLLNSVQEDVLVTRGIVGTIWAECCANVSQLLMNDEFRGRELSSSPFSWAHAAGSCPRSSCRDLQPDWSCGHRLVLRLVP